MAQRGELPPREVLEAAFAVIARSLDLRDDPWDIINDLIREGLLSMTLPEGPRAASLDEE